MPLLPAGERPQPPSSTPDNAGTLAHLAVQHWVQSGGWRDDADVLSLGELFREEAAKYSVVVEELLDGRMTESRLKAQEAALASAIRNYTGTNGSVVTEVLMYDDGNQLWGTIDLLVRSDQGSTIIDLKSGTDAAKATLPDDIRNQLLHYALLVLAESGATPKTIAVFSLRRGLRVLDYEVEDLKLLLADINSLRYAWIEGGRPAVPSPDNCYFCSRRLDCEAHWTAIDEWEDTDATQGELTLIENAANGSSSLTLTRDGTKVWISDVPVAVASSLKRGDVTRGVRLRQSKREIHDVQQREIWYADGRSAFHSITPSGSHDTDS